MVRNLIINFKKKKFEIAILENDILVEYYKNNPLYKGDIYIGKIIYIYKDMKAVFIDIGYYKYGFLNYNDIGKYYLSFKKKKIIYFKRKKNIKKTFKKGQYLIVQIINNIINNKGPKLTCKITFIGKYIILIPYKKKKILISKKIKKNFKNKFKIPYNNISIIIRTLSINTKLKKIKLEFYILLKIWYTIFLKIKKKIKKLYNNKNIFYEILKFKKIKYNKIICNNIKLCNEIKLYLYLFYKKKIKYIKYYKNKKIKLFEKYGIEKQKKILFNKYIYLSDGTNLIIEKTETLNIIDINSNMLYNDNSYKVNLFTIKEIVRQIRLRNMGGIIIIDLIDIKKKKNKKKIYKKFKLEMKNDNIKHKILPPSKFNLIEIIREKKFNNIKINKKNKNNIKSNIIQKIENFLNLYYKKKKKKKIILYVNPLLSTYLKYGFFSYRLKWYFKYQTWINIVNINKFKFFEYKIIKK